ncbi:MAG: WGR domain-containing protein [Magnetococcales bacterium]|nr:WGR domain-containing protein [Magnetococcales bacterium]
MKAYLQRFNPENGQIWYYAVRVQRDLLGQWQVIREWGRSGSPGTVRYAVFDHYLQAADDMSRLMEQLVKRGYHVVMREGSKPALVAYLKGENDHEPDS